ncbi:unnamed protein product [Dibothriocephalus latus]|uniref:26S proteasome complex subunit SEM1 n=1 Tax=Dibothriocephalus latus TaxID=60516 RepID=A0A3P7LJ96_DIBLA|nr:unnamed protein product [Dibothriocephalus latus]
MATVSAADKESNKPKAQLDLGILEEDDDFEEFPVDEWAGKAEDTEEVSLWEDNWDDDIVEEEFSSVLSLQISIDRMPEDESSDKPENSDDDQKYPSPTSSVRGPTFSSQLVIDETNNNGGSPIKQETISPQRPIEAFDPALTQSDLFLQLPTAPTSFIDSSTLAPSTAIKLEAPSNTELPEEARTASQRVSWNGETWTIEASDEENPFSDVVSSASTSDTEPDVSKQESAARSLNNDQDFRNSKAVDVDSFTISICGKNGPAVVEESNIRYFRVLLLCSVSLPVEASMWLPQHRLRPFYGRSEFELFMRSQLANTKNKFKAIRHFAVAPKHQAFWHAARDQAEAALTSFGKSLTSRFRFLGVHLPTLQAAWKAEDRKRKEALRQKQIAAGEFSSLSLFLLKSPW